MPRGKAVLSYSEQEELAAKVLALFPRTSSKTIAALIHDNYGIEFTASNFRRAKERAEGIQEEASEVRKAGSASPKLQYIEALFRLNPSLDPKKVNAKTQVFFGETTRGDIIAECAQRSQIRGVLSEDEARAIVEAYEMTRITPPELDLVGDATVEDLERPT